MENIIFDVKFVKCFFLFSLFRSGNYLVLKTKEINNTIYSSIVNGYKPK